MLTCDSVLHDNDDDVDQNNYQGFVDTSRSNPWPSESATRLSKKKGLPQNCPSPLMLGLGSGLCPLATCSKQSIAATYVAKGSLEQLSEI